MKTYLYFFLTEIQDASRSVADLVMNAVGKTFPFLVASLMAFTFLLTLAFTDATAGEAFAAGCIAMISGILFCGIFMAVSAYIEANLEEIFGSLDRNVPIYHWSQFSRLARRTESKIETFRFPSGVLLPALYANIAGTELLDVMKKHIFYGKPLPARDSEQYRDLRAYADDLVHQAIQLRSNLEKLLDGNGNYTDRAIDPRIAHAIIGASTESGELLQALVDHMNGKHVDGVNIVEEFSDIDWYKAIAFDVLGVEEPAARGNLIAKLKKRYPEKFDAQRAIDRDLVAERAALEGRSNG